MRLYTHSIQDGTTYPPYELLIDRMDGTMVARVYIHTGDDPYGVFYGLHFNPPYPPDVIAKRLLKLKFYYDGVNTEYKWIEPLRTMGNKWYRQLDRLFDKNMSDRERSAYRLSPKAMEIYAQHNADDNRCGYIALFKACVDYAVHHTNREDAGAKELNNRFDNHFGYFHCVETELIDPFVAMVLSARDSNQPLSYDTVSDQLYNLRANIELPAIFINYNMGDDGMMHHVMGAFMLDEEALNSDDTN